MLEQGRSCGPSQSREVSPDGDQATQCLFREEVEAARRPLR